MVMSTDGEIVKRGDLTERGGEMVSGDVGTKPGRRIRDARCTDLGHI